MLACNRATEESEKKEYFKQDFFLIALKQLSYYFIGYILIWINMFKLQYLSNHQLILKGAVLEGTFLMPFP